MNRAEHTTLKMNGWNPELGGGLKYVCFPPLPGEMIQFDQYVSETTNRFLFHGPQMAE